ncbi:MAG: YdcF family protein [Nitrospira sp.]|nr:YdcF family protein [Nitrospira sp.]
MVAFVARPYYRPILVFLGKYLVYEDPLQKADAIVVICGEFPFRILEALDIYQAGYAPLIVVSSKEEVERLQQLKKLERGYGYLSYDKMGALKDGIPEEALLVLEGPGDSTEQELTRLYRFLVEKNIKSVILVSSNYHTRRVMKLFNLIARGQVMPIVRASRYSKFVEPERWWLARWSIRFVCSEYLKLINYYIVQLRQSLLGGVFIFVFTEQGSSPQSERIVAAT